MAASRWARRAIPIVVGAAMVALLLDHVGWSAVHAAIASAGPWCLVVVVIDVAGLACDAAAIASLGFACGSRAASWLGTLVLLPALGMPLTAPCVLAVLSLGVLISWLSDAMPLGLGIADGGQCTLYTALGATPAVGLAVAMIGRARACLAGMVALAIAAVVARGRRPSWPLRRAVSV